MTQPIETIAVGQTIPHVNFQMKLDDGSIHFRHLIISKIVVSCFLLCLVRSPRPVRPNICPAMSKCG